MIYYVSTRRFDTTVRGMLRGYGRRLARRLTPLSYEEIFFERAGPIGHYIFTDFDRLTRYELDCAARFAAALQAAAPAAQIFNHPLKALERFPLLLALHKAGINDFTAIRLEGDARPSRYPVFIRCEDGYGGPETDLIHDDAGFDAALTDLDRRMLARRGRIAIGYAGERGADGFFRKYGAFKIGGRILPHHVQRNRGWVVKRELPREEWVVTENRADRTLPEAVDEEHAYIRDNPHADVLARAFAVAGIDFGRADYGIVNGRVQIYEINTNPHLPPSAKSDGRSKSREIKRARMFEAFTALDAPLAARGRVAYVEARPRAHDVRLPGWRLPASLARRVRDLLRRPRSPGPGNP